MGVSSSKRRSAADVEERGEATCTTLDHIYPIDAPRGTTCRCGKRKKGEGPPFIVVDERLKVGDIIRTTRDGPLVRIEMVNDSRARGRIINAEQARNYVALPEEEGGGRIMNLSSRACVIHVSPKELEQELRNNPDRMEVSSMAVAAVPVAGKAKTSNAAQNKAQKASLASKKAAAPARPLTGAAAKAKERAANSPKAPKTVRQCACGCGEETQGYFFPGHDARFKSWMIKIERGQAVKEEILPKSVLKAFEFKKKGPGFVTTTNYKGEKHSGYDTK